MRKSQMTWLHPRPNGLKEAIQNREGRENDESTFDRSTGQNPVLYLHCICKSNSTGAVRQSKQRKQTQHAAVDDEWVSAHNRSRDPVGQRCGWWVFVASASCFFFCPGLTVLQLNRSSCRMQERKKHTPDTVSRTYRHVPTSLLQTTVVSISRANEACCL